MVYVIIPELKITTGFLAFVILPSIFAHQHARECVGVSVERRSSECGKAQE